MSSGAFGLLVASPVGVIMIFPFSVASKYRVRGEIRSEVGLISKGFDSLELGDSSKAAEGRQTGRLRPGD